MTVIYGTKIVLKPPNLTYIIEEDNKSAFNATDLSGYPGLKGIIVRKS